MITIHHADIIGGEIMNHKLTHIDREASVLEASKLMRKSRTTELLVTDKARGTLRPIGVVTASDIVTRVMAADLDPAVMTVGDIAESGIAAKDTIDSDTGWIWRAQEQNNEALAVLDGDGHLVATLRLDELKDTFIHQAGTA